MICDVCVHCQLRVGYNLTNLVRSASARALYTLPVIDREPYTWDYLLKYDMRHLAMTTNAAAERAKSRVPEAKPELSRPSAIKRTDAPIGVVSIDLDSDDEDEQESMVVETVVEAPVKKPRVEPAAAPVRPVEEQVMISRDQLAAILHRHKDSDGTDKVSSSSK